MKALVSFVLCPLSFVLCPLSFALAAPVAPASDDAVRSGFLISRRDAAPKRRTQRPKRHAALGLGYSVFRATPTGTVRVDAAQPLRDGDLIRLVVEPNEDGYLYVFNSDDKGTPATMIYPDPRLNGGANRVRAHVPYEVPSSREADPNLRWLHLEGGPVADDLHVVVSREPLTGIPVGRDLVAYCATRDDCLWSPDGRAWAGIAARADAAQDVSLAAATGQLLSEVERGAIERTVRLRPSAPSPSVVRMNTSRAASVLVTRITLVH
jgi:hypothetical protein